jgi:hypothetical protein
MRFSRFTSSDSWLANFTYKIQVTEQQYEQSCPYIFVDVTCTPKLHSIIKNTKIQQRKILESGFLYQTLRKSAHAIWNEDFFSILNKLWHSWSRVGNNFFLLCYYQLVNLFGTTSAYLKWFGTCWGPGHLKSKHANTKSKMEMF